MLQECKDINTRSYYPTASVVKDKLIITGGNVNTNKHNNITDIYDANTLKYLRSFIIPYQSDTSAHNLIDNIAYYFGLKDNEGNPLAYSLDINDGILNNIHPQPKHIQSQATVAIGNNIYTFGGEVDDTPTDISYVYDTIINTWFNIKPLPKPLLFHTASKLSETTIIITGGLSTGYKISNKSYIYDIETDTYIETNPIPTKLYTHSQTTLLNNNIILLGGIAYNYYNTNIYIYDSLLHTWSVYDKNKLNVEDIHFVDMVTLPNGKILLPGVCTESGNKTFISRFPL